jgi:hypothetical protein
MPVQSRPAPRPGHCCRSAALGLPELKGARLQHRVPAAEDTVDATPLPVDEAVASVSWDGAYDTKACHEAIAREAHRP